QTPNKGFPVSFSGFLAPFSDFLDTFVSLKALVSHFFSYGCNLCSARFKRRVSRNVSQSRNRKLKPLKVDRLDEICLRACAQSLLYVMLVGYGGAKQNRGVRVEFSNQLAQINSSPVRQPVIENVEIKVLLSRKAQPLGEVVSTYEPIFFEVDCQ